MCDAKMRPFQPINDTELQCELTDSTHTHHRCTLLDYAYKGSSTEIQWAETDRRTFRGTWSPCSTSTCILPLNHRGNHAS